MALNKNMKEKVAIIIVNWNGLRFSKNKENIAGMGKKSRAIAEQMSWDGVVNEYNKIYQNV